MSCLAWIVAYLGGVRPCWVAVIGPDKRGGGLYTGGADCCIYMGPCTLVILKSDLGGNSALRV